MVADNWKQEQTEACGLGLLLTQPCPTFQFPSPSPTPQKTFVPSGNFSCCVLETQTYMTWSPSKIIFKSHSRILQKWGRVSINASDIPERQRFCFCLFFKIKSSFTFPVSSAVPLVTPKGLWVSGQEGPSPSFLDRYSKWVSKMRSSALVYLQFQTLTMDLEKKVQSYDDKTQMTKTMVRRIFNVLIKDKMSN